METIDILRRCSLFNGLDDGALAQLADQCAHVVLSSGAVLYHPGDAADAMFIVVSGRLQAKLTDRNGVLMIGRLQAVGEIGLFSGAHRDAVVQAVRDCELLRIDREPLLAFLEAHPATLLHISREIIARLRRATLQMQRQNVRQQRVFALLPAHPGIDLAGSARALVTALGKLGTARSVDADAVDTALGADSAQVDAAQGADNARLVNYLNALEGELGEGHLLYQANPHADQWSRRCMRQADRILLLAAAGDPPMLTPMVADALRLAGGTPIDLLVLRQGTRGVHNVAAWRTRLNTRSHYFLRPAMAADYDALARQLCGRALGLVLGGGGARGFAHLGLLRALETLQIPIDLTGGSSMGAYLAALHACGMDARQVREAARATFVEHNYLNDYMLPRVSLIRGRKLLTRLREVFGERQIEGLAKPFFCVTTNLTRGIASVHDAGELAMWVGTSMAIPGIAPPVAWRGDLHADGAVINSLPTDVMAQMERGPIIASGVSTEGAIAAAGVEGPEPEALLNQHAGGARVSLIDILFRTATLTSESGVRARAERADCYLRMPVDGVGLFDWKRLDEIAETSYGHAMRHLEPLRDQLLAGGSPVTDRSADVMFEALPSPAG